MEATVERHLAQMLDITLEEANKIWNTTEKALIASIVEDQELRLRGFGTFVTVNRPEQVIKHPTSDQIFKVPAYKAVDFRASKNLRQAVNPNLEIK